MPRRQLRPEITKPTITLPTLEVGENNVSIMITKLDALKNALYHITSGKDEFHTVQYWNEREHCHVTANGRYSTVYDGKLEFGNFYVKEAGYIYSNLDVISLQGQIQELCNAINGIPNSNAADTQKRLVLAAAYDAIVNPSYQNRQRLKQVAQEAPGHGNVWTRVGIVLKAILLGLTIVGLTCLPCYLAERRRDWDSSYATGLSLAAENMLKVIEKTEAPRRISRHSFFVDPRELSKGPQTLSQNLSASAPEAMLGADEPTAPLLK